MKYNPDIHHRRSVRLRGYDYGKEGMYFITICTQNRIHFFGEVENGEMILTPFGEIAHREWEQLPKRWPHVELGAFQIMPNHMHGVLLIHRPVSANTNLGTGATTFGVITLDGATTTDGATTRVAPTDDGVDTVSGAATRAAPTLGDGGNLVGATLVVAPNDDATAPNDNGSLFPPEIPFSKIQWATRPYLGQIVGAYKSIVSTACLNYHKETQPGVWLDKIWQRGFDERIIRNAEAFDKISNYIINNPKNWKEDKFFD